MSEKRDLYVLASFLDRPISEFVDSEPFKKLEQEADVIKVIEPFGLPEVKRLICCSTILGEEEWAEKYSVARKLYNDIEDLDVFTLLVQYHNISEYENRILACVDQSILEIINAYFKDKKAEMEQQKKERASLRGKITKAKKKIKAMASQDGDLEKSKPHEQASNNMALSENTTPKIPAPLPHSEDELRVFELSEQITENENYLKNFEKHASKTESYLYQAKNVEGLERIRQEVYKIIDIIKPPAEQKFLDHYITTGELSKEDELSLRNYDFLQRFLKQFDKPDYRNIAFPVLANLYSDNAIDLECDIIKYFISSHSRMLAEYLEDKYSSSLDFLDDPENSVFIEHSIRGTIAGKTDYVTWWNSIRKASDWNIIFNLAEELFDESLLNIAAKIMKYVNGTSMYAFMEYLQSEHAAVHKLTQTEFILELISQESLGHKELIKSYLRNIDQNARKLQRSIGIKERQINRYSQELFSALYLPLEQLEELAINLRLSDGEISCSLVAGQIIDLLANLRVSLSDIGLYAADEVAAWKNQSFVSFDPNKHKMPFPTCTVGEPVKLQTLGFSYKDDEGNNKLRAAEVYIPVPMDSKSNQRSVNRRTKQNNRNLHAINSSKRAKKGKKNSVSNTSKNNKKSKKRRKGRMNDL